MGIAVSDQIDGNKKMIGRRIEVDNERGRTGDALMYLGKNTGVF
jgi:hypothetical protein